MVMRLPSPQINDSDLIDAVVSERQGGTNAIYFSGIREDWKKRVAEFVAARGNPEKVKPWPNVQPHKKKYLNLYKSPRDGSSQRPILEKLRDRTLPLCPACGEDGTPNTLDHYLPQESYPELSITPTNLTPMCDACQAEKLSQTLDALNQRLFLHPYYDDFIGAQTVVLRIGEPFNAPAEWKLEPHPALTPEQASLVQRHLEALAVPRRYSHFFKSQYMRLLRLVHTMRESGQNIHQSVAQFKKMESYKSLSAWPHVFYAGVLGDPDLISYLETAALPPHL